MLNKSISCTFHLGARMIIRWFNRVITLLYKLTPNHALQHATVHYLDNIELLKPTADARTILQLEEIFSPTVLTYLHCDLSDTLKNIVSLNESIELGFNFSSIQSLTASKSFGAGIDPCINGSWFKDLYAWGRGMYPGKNLQSENNTDWLRNIRHIEHEGFHHGSRFTVLYYTWIDRYVASNSGGSHHAAKVVFQSIRDGIPYFRDINLIKIDINKSIINSLEDKYYSFIILPKNTNSKYNFQNEIRKHISCGVAFIESRNYYDDLIFVFIPKSDMNISPTEFEKWLTSASELNKIISFPLYLNNPQNFHTKNYLHEVNSIYLGKPFI